MPRLHFALDLKDDPALIAEYEAWHRPRNIWPEIPQFLHAAGVRDLEIFRCGDRLVMVMDVPEDFSAARQAELGQENPRTSAWEELMWKYQRSLPFAGPGEKWVPMARVFSLREALAEPEQGT
jgi:L-rhamnose mutarotase